MDQPGHYMNQRRLRANAHVRELAATVTVSHKEMIQPLFVEENLPERVENRHMTGVFSDTISSVVTQIAADMQQGIHKFLLFPIPAARHEIHFDFSFAAEVVQTIKNAFGDSVWLAADLCLCSYTNSGHCGILDAAGKKLLNAETVNVLANYALQLARAGADCIAPSDMTDGRIGAIRRALDEAGFDEVAIMSYSSKFSSNFYGPFRDVCKSSPNQQNSLKDRKTYQIDPRNPLDAMASSLRDASEGADFLMVKPGLPYLDIIAALSQRTDKPIAVYHVSGEYAAIELLAKESLVEAKSAHIETWIAFKRAGATVIITYAARWAKQWLG